MSIPVGDVRFEDRGEHRVVAHLRIEGMDQAHHLLFGTEVRIRHPTSPFVSTVLYGTHNSRLARVRRRFLDLRQAPCAFTAGVSLRATTCDDPLLKHGAAPRENPRISAPLRSDLVRRRPRGAADCLARSLPLREWKTR